LNISDPILARQKGWETNGKANYKKAGDCEATPSAKNIERFVSRDAQGYLFCREQDYQDFAENGQSSPIQGFGERIQ
jgi:hypothetical protein